jgi:serine/threonine protein kinase
LGMCENSPEICIITEYMPRGSLYRILHDRKLSIDFPLMKRICLDVAKGMNYLHKEGVIHRDLKSHNLLVAEHWTVKVW